ncbi:MAG: 4-(cytidine 5'-diphospho)-2-C-methyl-D-erythritol kinase [Betaproteobacteria bacterium]|nr:4-(cytidine 5'-diphospho)-2-C-methyl-D-erythritol kinase [Betaproteobacteria bacterium]
MRALLGVPAPAKLNWFLHVLGRRDAGLHELQTVFQFIDWCDEIDFELREDGEVSRDGADGLGDDDLCVRAARALQRHTGCGLGVHMRLRKHIPMQAGLGGGSSDAASVLLALNRLWGLGLRRGELQALGEGLGADVPVFVFGRGAFAEGSGTRLRALELPCWQALVAWPGAGLSTAQVFASESLTRNTPARTMEGFCEHLKRVLGEKPGSCCGRDGMAGMAEALGFGANDLQGVATGLLPRLRELGRWLEHRCGAPARMSGSGSAMFAPWPADAVLGEVPGSWSVRVCRALSRHPLLDWVAD